MRPHYIIGASAIALCAALGSEPASATGGAARTLSVPPIADYNAGQVKVAGGIVTVPSGLATYSVRQESLEMKSRFTETLPTGFSFSSQPALTDTGATKFVLGSGGIGAQSATFTVTTAPLTPGQSASLLGFAVQGATALETPIPVAAALPISMQATNNSQILNNDPKPLSAKAFASEPGISPPFGFNGQTVIDLSSPSLGTLFLVDGADTPTVAAVQFQIQPETLDQATETTPVLSPDGSTNTLSTSDTATVTVAGAFNGISAFFMSTTGDCANPVLKGTAAPAQVSVAGVPLNTLLYACLTSGGTTLLQEISAIQVTTAPGADTSDFLTLTDSYDLPGLFTYTGGGVINVTNFLTGDDAGYASLLRVNNGGSTPTNLFALVQPDTGGPLLTGSLGSIGAGQGTVFSEAAVQAAVTGLDLANSGQRATLQLIVTGDFAVVAASSFLVNPGGVVDNVGVQQETAPPPPP